MSVGGASLVCYIGGFSVMTSSSSVDCQNLGIAGGNQENWKRSSKSRSQEASHASSDSTSQEIVADSQLSRDREPGCDPMWCIHYVFLSRHDFLKRERGSLRSSFCPQLADFHPPAISRARWVAPQFKPLELATTDLQGVQPPMAMARGLARCRRRVVPIRCGHAGAMDEAP